MSDREMTPPRGKRRQRHVKGPGPWCGTAGGYNNHSCRCDDCTKAHRENCYDYKDRRAQTAQCGEDDCTGGLYAKGLCNPCYQASRRGGRKRPRRIGKAWPGPTVPADDVADARALLVEMRPFSIDTGAPQ